MTTGPRSETEPRLTVASSDSRASKRYTPSAVPQQRDGAGKHARERLERKRLRAQAAPQAEPARLQQQSSRADARLDAQASAGRSAH